MDKIKEAGIRFATDNEGRWDYHEASYQSFIAGATSEAAREYWEGQGWVRVEDGLPPVHRHVLTYHANSLCVWANFLNIDGSWSESINGQNDISHWRPMIPKPPNQ